MEKMFNREESNSKKTELQKEAAKSSSKNNLVLKWCTGLGKTRAAINIIKSHSNIKKFYICVNEITHIKNWEDEFKVSGNEDLLEKCHIFCYASLKKYVKDIIDSKTKKSDGNHYYFIFDEYHHISENRFQLLKTIPIYKFIALSATGTTESDYRLDNLSDLTSYPLLVNTISPSDAIKEGIIPTPIVYVLDIDLGDNKKERDEIFIKTKGKQKDDTPVYKVSYPDRWDYINDLKVTSNYKLLIACTQKEKYSLINDNIEYWKKTYHKLGFQAKRNGEKEPEWAKKKWLFSANERKRFIAHCKTKTAIKLINTELSRKRFICFTGSIEQCETLGKPGTIVHSNVSSKDCEKILFSFNNYKIDSLYCVFKLREGQNLNGIEAGLVIQLDHQEKSFVQELGRVLRSSYPIFYIIRLKGTRDDEFFNNALAGFNKEYIKEFKFISE